MENVLQYVWVDVFAEGQWAGNQLAVVRSGNRLEPAAMQRIAKEMNLSETTFLISETERDGGYDVRIFTPSQELPFAGHPTLGTAYVIREKLYGGKAERIALNLKAGQIPVEFGEDGILWMTQLPPSFGEPLLRQDAADVLGMPVDRLDDRFPVQAVSTGSPFLIVPLRSLEDVKQASLHVPLFFERFGRDLARGVLVFAPEAYDDQAELAVRVFCGPVGIVEDPATGSANGCFAGYLSKHSVTGGAIVDTAVQQGYEIGRPSTLYLRSRPKGQSIEVRVGGRVRIVAEGKLFI